MPNFLSEIQLKQFFFTFSSRLHPLAALQPASRPASPKAQAVCMLLWRYETANHHVISFPKGGKSSDHASQNCCCCCCCYCCCCCCCCCTNGNHQSLTRSPLHQPGSAERERERYIYMNMDGVIFVFAPNTLWQPVTVCHGKSQSEQCETTISMGHFQ